MRTLFAILFLWCSCLPIVGCTATLKSPAEAFAVGSQKDRSIEASKSIFGTKVKIPLTDLDLKMGKASAHFNRATGTYDIDLQDFDARQSFSSTMLVENARIKDNQELYVALTTAQQEVYDRRIDAWKEFGIHGIDAAAQAVGVLAKMPGGEEQASGLIETLMNTLGPQMLPQLIAALTKNGVAVAPRIVPKIVPAPIPDGTTTTTVTTETKTEPTPVVP